MKHSSQINATTLLLVKDDHIIGYETINPIDQEERFVELMRERELLIE